MNVVQRALHAYGMAFAMRREGERTASPTSEYSLRCVLAADKWLREARRLRRIAEVG